MVIWKILDELLLVHKDLRVGENYVRVNPSFHNQIVHVVQ